MLFTKRAGWGVLDKKAQSCLRNCKMVESPLSKGVSTIIRLRVLRRLGQKPGHF